MVHPLDDPRLKRKDMANGHSPQSARRVLVVEDDDALREAISFTLGVHDIAHGLASNGVEALAMLNCETPAIIISDVRMPQLDGIGLLRCVRQQMPEVPFVLMTAHADVPAAVDAIKSGAREFLLKPFQPETLIEIVERHRADPCSGDPVGEDAAFRQMLTRLRRIAASELSVLLSGESGTGKEVLARDVHVHSARSGGPFVAINCAAIPKDLLEATLFGYERGAFTGAQKSQQGKFELAHGGTLFLDEIGEMPPELQAKLLRVLQERVVERVGSHQEIALDFRLVAATNRKLEQAVREGRFREDLYFRIGVFPLEIPPLRARPDDIEVLANHFLRRYAAPAGRPGARLSAQALERMRQHPWPGNVRELENMIQRALLMADSTTVGIDDLGLPTQLAGQTTSVRPAEASFDVHLPRPSHGHLNAAQTPPLYTDLAAAQPGFTTAAAATYPDETVAGETSAAHEAVAVAGRGQFPGSAADSLSSYVPQADSINHQPERLDSMHVRAREREHILDVLRRVNGSRKQAIALLGISERALRYKLKQYREEGFQI
jgi:two-component system response regulator FlrC